MIVALIKLGAWIGFVCLSLVVVENSWPIVATAEQVPFLQERIELTESPMWRSMLALHVAAGAICLLASFLQFFRSVLRRAPWLHRWLGRIYTWSILGVLAPSGFYLAVYAKGGLPGVAGFLVLGILTTHFTWKGWLTIQRGRTQEHAGWMIRSFAMVTTALTFRIYNVLFAQVEMAAETVYLVALYLSLFGNLLAAEWLLARMKHRSFNKNAKNIEHEETPYRGAASFRSAFPQGVRSENGI